MLLKSSVFNHSSEPLCNLKRNPMVVDKHDHSLKKTISTFGAEF